MFETFDFKHSLEPEKEHESVSDPVHLITFAAAPAMAARGWGKESTGLLGRGSDWPL